MPRIAVIGSGFSGLSSACYLSAAGHEVDVFEKNSEPGGRARQLKTEEGFVFDMGPSWYWMPDVYEKFFNDFGYSVSDFYVLEKLDPGFEVVFGKNDIMQVPSDFNELCAMFESIEKGSADRLKAFMNEAEYKYKAGMQNLIYKPGLSFSEFADPDILKNAFKLQLLTSLSRHVRNFFSDRRLITLMEFPVLFLGATAKTTPALYSLMNYAALKIGTFYPMGGFGKVIEAFMKIAGMNGVCFYFNSPVEKINTAGSIMESITVNGDNLFYDGVIASADYHHVESKLLDGSKKNYEEKYWDKKTFAPSCLIYYLGISKQIPGLNHHTLFFDENLDQHSEEIYENPGWPEKPLFYVCCPSKTDKNTAPDGHENIFLLMPVAPGLKDDERVREGYFQIMIDRIEKNTNEKINPFIVYKKSYCINDFISDYNSYKGNAYGLANTLMQTAVFKPKIKNNKIKNLFYTGQSTVPGPGVPPSIISGKIAAGLLEKELKEMNYEVFV
jgi:phytoene desaturase